MEKPEDHFQSQLQSACISHIRSNNGYGGNPSRCHSPADDRYSPVVQKVMNYIFVNLEDDLSLQRIFKAMAAPYVGVKFMPTGGINPTNVREYLAYDRILACGGSWMVKGSLIDAGEFDKIEELTKEAVEIVKESRGK